MPGFDAVDTYTTPLTQISVSCDGNIWGLTASGGIYRFNQQSQQFEQIAGSLSQIAVGFGNAVFGINSAGNVYQFDNATGQFVQIPGTMSNIVVGSNESVYGLNSAGSIYQYNVTTKTWTQLPGTLAQLAVAADGTLWGLNSSGQIYYYTPSLCSQIMRMWAFCSSVRFFALRDTSCPVRSDYRMTLENLEWHFLDPLLVVQELAFILHEENLCKLTNSCHASGIGELFMALRRPMDLFPLCRCTPCSKKWATTRHQAIEIIRSACRQTD